MSQISLAEKPYPCPYWGIADCYYHYGGSCLGSCRNRDEYKAWNTAHPEDPAGGSRPSHWRT